MALALFGSGEFTPAVKDIDSYLIDTFSPKSIAILPTAAGNERDYLKWVEMAQSHYGQLKLDVVPVPVISSHQANDPKYLALLDKVDWIFFSGGDPNFLLNVLKGSSLWDLVLKKYQSGTLLSGSSAGAMVMGSYIVSSPFKALLQATDLNWTPAFNLVPFTIFPHFDKFKQHSTILNRLISNSPDEVKKSWVGIDENTALILKDTQQIVLGKGQIEVHSLDS